MKWLTGTKDWGMLLLAIWLIAQGGLAFVNVPIARTGAILAAMAIVIGRVTFSENADRRQRPIGRNVRFRCARRGL